MNWYKKYIISKKIQNKDSNFSWVRLDVPKKIKDVHSSVTKEIKETDLYYEDQGGDDWSYGIEDAPHITVKYGLEFDEPDEVLESLDGEKGGNVEIEDIEIFEQDDYDVLVARCKSKALNKLHDKLSKDLKIEDDYPEYKPHITIAYFKKGRAKKYKSMAFKALTYYLLDFDFDKVVFEDRNDKETVIKLD
jgi:2'-5' RNA ligase